MGEPMNKDGWGQVTILSPGAFADPREMNAVIRELFCHDSILEYQRRVAEAAMREAVAGWRRAMAKKGLSADSDAGKAILEAVNSVLDSFDPESDEWDGFFPPVMLCPEHDSPVKPKHGKGIVFTACPGVPWCRAHEGVRVQ
jgi:hypothetical protein